MSTEKRTTGPDLRDLSPALADPLIAGVITLGAEAAGCHFSHRFIII